MKALAKKIIRLVGIPFVLPDYFRFRRAAEHSSRFTLSLKDFYPQIKDKTVTTGFDRHYVYHTSWAARTVAKIRPGKHIDISSSLYFSGITSAFIPIDFYDYRPADLKLSNLTSKHADLMALPFPDNSVISISCMHTIEHIGLGRYGDPIDPEGDIKAIKELKRVVAPGGSLLFVTPIGNQNRIEFNAHRIYNKEAVMAQFSDFECKEFTLIPEHEADGGLITDPSSELLSRQRYGCGCFWFVKPSQTNISVSS